MTNKPTNYPAVTLDTPRRVWLDICLDTLRHNYRHIATAVAPCSVMAMLKANAYGLGMRPIAEVLARENVGAFGVAEPREAFALCDLGIPVYILGSLLADEIPALVAMGITLPISDLNEARAISLEAVRQSRTATVHFKIDTGMGRLGMLAKDATDTIVAACRLPGLKTEGIYSHCPVACQAGNDYTQAQIRSFIALLDTLARVGIQFEKRHIANSDAINNFPETHQPPFNMVRTGINLHGSFDNAGMRILDLAPVLTLKTRLTAARTLPAGTHIGYGLTYRLPRSTRVGTISAGYADGLPLALSNCGHVLIHGVPCPIIGRLSMDYTTVSLEEVPHATVGDEVICLGGKGPQAITVKDWARLKATHSYDIICSLGPRVERRYT